MIFRTKTSKETMEIFDRFNQREHLQPFALAKLCISLSIKNNYKYDENKLKDSLGVDLNRQTITGDYDLLFKTLIEMNEGKYLEDKLYFPNVIKAYIDNGAILLEQEYKYATDFYTHLVELDKSL